MIGGVAWKANRNSEGSQVLPFAMNCWRYLLVVGNSQYLFQKNGPFTAEQPIQLFFLHPQDRMTQICFKSLLDD